MDPLAHTLTGVALAHSGVKQRIGRGAVLALILASNMVDIDIFGVFFRPEPAWMYRRMWTHSLLTAPLLIVLGAFLFSRLFRNARWSTWCGVFALGVAFHIFMDLINSYGIVLFFPLSLTRFELSWVFIIDLYIWGILILALLAPAAARRLGWKLRSQTAARGGVAALLLYLSLCGMLHHRSLAIVREHIARSGTQYEFAYVFPEPFGPWRFRGVIRSGDLYEVYEVQPLAGALRYAEAFRTDAQKPGVKRLIESDTGRMYHWFFKAPVWQQLSDESALVRDLRFHTLLVRRESPFVYLVRENGPVGLVPEPASEPPSHTLR